MTLRFLVFGAGGQVGRTLAEIGLGETIGLGHADADICDEIAVAKAVRKYKPTSLVNVAAYTAVDKAESEAAEAFRVNGDGARMVAQVANAADIPLLHLSTDYVFDGRSKVPYKESDAACPLSVYGRSKEAGERAIRTVCRKHLILRTSWVYSPFGTNFVRTMLRLGSQQSDLSIIDDQTGCPTAAADVAIAIVTILKAIERRNFDDWGTYHYAGADAVTWYDFAKLIFAQAKRYSGRLPKLHPIRTINYPTPALRPPYSVLSTEKGTRIFGITPRPLRQSLSECLERLDEQG